jgi:hypothetical protein
MRIPPAERCQEDFLSPLVLSKFRKIVIVTNVSASAANDYADIAWAPYARQRLTRFARPVHYLA